MSMIYHLKQEFKHIESKEVEEKFKNIKYDEYCEILQLFKTKKHFFKNLENREQCCIKFVFKEDDFIDLYLYSIRYGQKEVYRMNIFYYIENIVEENEEIRFFTEEEIKIMKEYKSRWRIQKFKMLSQNFIRFKKGKKS